MSTINYNNKAEIQYEISNDIRCPSPFVDEVMFDWRNSSETFGWTGVFNVTDLSCIGGELSGYILTGETESYIEQPLPQTSIIASVNRIDIALRVKSDLATQAKIQFIKQTNEDTDPNSISELGQEIEFDLIADGNFHLYKLDPNPYPAWEGRITHFRFYPGLSLNPGDSFHIEFFRVLTKTDYTQCDCKEDDFFYNSPSPCTGAGRAFSLEGSSLELSDLSIDDDNDTILIKMNKSNWREVKLPHTKLPKSNKVIAEIVETEVNKLSGFGFNNFRCTYLPSKKFRFEGGIRGAHTSLEIQYTESSFLRRMGFFDSTGRELFESFQGVDDDSELPYFESTNKELKNVREASTTNALSLAPDNYEIEIGNPFFSEPPFYTFFDARGLTLIDYLKPATKSGYINELYFSGTVFQSPQSKIKIFRPNGTNGLEFIDEFPVEPKEFYSSAIISLPELPYNQIRFDYKVLVDIYIQEGDVLAISNAIIYGDFVLDYTKGQDVTYKRIVRAFMIGDGDISEDIEDISSLEAFGESAVSLPIYGVKTKRKRKTSFFIDLQEKKAVDKVLIQYKALELLRSSSNVSSQITTVDVETYGGTHVHWRYIPTSSGLEQTTTTHLTQALNKELLVDGIKQSFNADEDTFFYLDGDGELNNTDFSGAGIVQETSFMDDRFDITINLSQNFEKKIGVINLWFVDHQNWSQYGLFYKKAGSKLPFKLLSVFFDDKPVSKQSIYLNNPLVLPDADDPTFQIFNAGISVPHKKITFVVEPVETKTVIFEVYQHRSTKMTEIELMSTESVTQDGYEIKGSDMFTLYVAEEDLNFKEVGFLTDNVVTFAETNTSIIDVGKPVRYMKLEVEPLLIMDLYNVKLLSEKKDSISQVDLFSQITSSTEETTINVDYEEDREILVKNKTGQTADLFVDILRDDVSQNKETVLLSKLNDLESITNPVKGPSGKYNFDDDVELKILFNVAKNKNSYGAYVLNSSNHGDSDWINLGTIITDETSINPIEAPIGYDCLLGGDVFYSGIVESAGVYTETFDIEYTVHIDVTNGTLAGLGTGVAPKFTVTSSPSIDDVATPITIANYDTYYPVGTLGVLIKFNDSKPFGEGDCFTIVAHNSTFISSIISATDYGHIAIDLGSHFPIDTISLSSSSERVGSTIVSWKNDDEFFSTSDGNTPKITAVQFKNPGILNGLSRWVKVDWDFTQTVRGGIINNVYVYSKAPFHYSNYWWDTTPSDKGLVSKDFENHSSFANSMSSLLYSYYGDNSDVTYYLLEGTIEKDELWSFKDFFSFYIYTESIQFEYIKVRLGSSEEDYYQWEVNPSDCSLQNWTRIDLRFSDGLIVGKPEIYKEINNLSLIVKSESDFVFYIDSFFIRRSRFEDTEFDNGIYLRNRELVSFSPIESLSLREGSLDFWITPDFNSSGYFENTEEIDPDTLEISKSYKYYFDEREVTSTVITLLAGLDFKAFLVAQPGLNGLYLATNNYVGERQNFTQRPNFDFNSGPHHIGINWRYDEFSMTLEMRFYLNGYLSQTILTPWVPTREDSPSIILGGPGDTKLFTIVPSSCNAVIDNVRVFNFYRTDFLYLMGLEEESEDKLKTTDLFLISVNDGGFVEYGSASLPIIVEDVDNEEEVNVKIRFLRPDRKIPSSLPRKARIEMKWRF